MRNLLISYLMLMNFVVFAQDNNPEAEVKLTIHNLFTAMRTGDSVLVSNLFYDGAKIVSVIRTQEGDYWTQQEPVSKFINAVIKPHKGVWNEKISNLEIRIDGGLAQCWMDYSFYLDEKFSHCGVNAMHLIHDGNSWKILQITDTRRVQDCETGDKK